MSKATPVPPSDMRREYQLHELDEADVSSDPIEQFGRWFEDAKAAKVLEPTVMTLATADSTGKPDARIVLLKEFDSRGFVFYTNKQSQKGRELAENPRACLVFYWEQLERQVRIDGTVQDVDHAAAEKYFHSRPVASQIGAWVSQQSSVITSRAELEKLEAELTRKYSGQVIPLPDYWGGYRVVPGTIEFWQGRRSRLHDRLRYSLIQDQWKIERLSP
jgi:pyridoxamine 5'-phosphate oxidase